MHAPSSFIFMHHSAKYVNQHFIGGFALPISLWVIRCRALVLDSLTSKRGIDLLVYKGVPLSLMILYGLMKRKTVFSNEIGDHIADCVLN